MPSSRLYDQPGAYQIRVSGHLDSSWSEWLSGLAIFQEEGQTTLLEGTIADQAALYSLLIKVRDLGLTLISLNRTQEA